MSNVIFLGATRGIGRALAREMAQRGDAIHLLGRNPEQLALSAQDLEARGARGSVGYTVCDLEQSEGFKHALQEADEALQGADTVVVTAGLFATQDDLESDLEFTKRVLDVNFSGTVLFCEHARQLLLKHGGGTLCVFSSVAGDRGRKPIALYGATKAGLSHYLESLDHKHRLEGLKVVCVKPGFVRTAMTQGLQEPPFAADPETVARRVMRGIEKGEPVVYAPDIWALVMFAIRKMPRSVMRRVGF